MLGEHREMAAAQRFSRQALRVVDPLAGPREQFCARLSEPLTLFQAA